ncbi:hypothetical protein [Nocardia asiatica]|uniref:hypothetical protein n=1 Tax=Nocardia asiatica TaxID=209252 RepID=UPI003EE0B7FD
MNEDDNNYTDSVTDLVSRVRRLIERSSLGTEGARLLRQRTHRDRIERIRNLADQRAVAETSPFLPLVGFDEAAVAGDIKLHDCLLPARLSRAVISNPTPEPGTAKGIGATVPPVDVSTYASTSILPRSHAPDKTSAPQVVCMILQDRCGIGVGALFSAPAMGSDGRHRISAVLSMVDRFEDSGSGSQSSYASEVRQLYARTIVAESLLSGPGMKCATASHFDAEGKNLLDLLRVLIERYFTVGPQNLFETYTAKPKPRGVAKESAMKALLTAAIEREKGISADMQAMPYGTMREIIKLVTPTGGLTEENTKNAVRELQQDEDSIPSWVGKLAQNYVRESLKVASEVQGDACWVDPNEIRLEFVHAETVTREVDSELEHILSDYVWEVAEMDFSSGCEQALSPGVCMPPGGAPVALRDRINQKNSSTSPNFLTLQDKCNGKADSDSPSGSPRSVSSHIKGPRSPVRRVPRRW